MGTCKKVISPPPPPPIIFVMHHCSCENHMMQCLHIGSKINKDRKISIYLSIQFLSSLTWIIFTVMNKLYACLVLSAFPHFQRRNRHTSRVAGTCIFIPLRAFFFFFFCIADPSDPPRSVVLPAECDWSSSAALLSCEVELTGSPHPSRLDAGARRRSRGAVVCVSIPRHSSAGLDVVLCKFRLVQGAYFFAHEIIFPS